MRYSDYFYASIPSFALAGLLAQWVPDLNFLQGIEKLGIVGILAGGILFFAIERRRFIARGGERLEILERRFDALEIKVTTGNDKVVSLLGQQLEALREIKCGQEENFSRMWQLTLNSIKGNGTTGDQFQGGEGDVLRPVEGQKKS